MMISPDTLVTAARKAGMSVPANVEDFDAEVFPHFQVFCNVQLYRPITWGEHWDNAKVIAAIPVKELKQLTLDKLIAKGLHYKI